MNPSTRFPPPRAAYVHVPFCVHRCGYCDFTVVADRDDLISAYLEALATELRLLESPRIVDTLFLGGGTPTYLEPSALSRLLKLVTHWFPLSVNAEFSVEANPAGFDVPRMKVLAEQGVNRVSLGVQSFDDDVLKTLERDHRREDVVRCVRNLQQHFENLSLDLIFGVPGQTPENWEQTLEEALALGPQHLSTYGLTFEKGTRFWARREKGELVQAPEDSERTMYAHAMDRLATAGYLQYEISSFAQPGFRSRHNQVYWAGQSYYGSGPGAASYIAGKRQINHRSVVTWIKRLRAGVSPVGEAEELAPEDHARERIVLALRTNDGLNLSRFALETGYNFETLAGTVAAKHIAAGLLEQFNERIRLTREGRFLADSVIVDYL